MTELSTIFSKNDTIVSKKIEDEFVLVPISNNVGDMNQLFTLKDTGAFIWEQINGKNSVEDILNLLLDEFEIDSDTAIKDIFRFLEELEGKKMISIQEIQK